MTDESQWLIRTENALFAHFFQPDGSSRPGADWAVSLRHGDSAYRVTVRAYFSNDMTERARKDTQYQAMTVRGFISDLLAQGWTPDQPRDLVIVIGNPPEGESPAAKPWWRLW